MARAICMRSTSRRCAARTVADAIAPPPDACANLEVRFRRAHGTTSFHDATRPLEASASRIQGAVMPHQHVNRTLLSPPAWLVIGAVIAVLGGCANKKADATTTSAGTVDGERQDPDHDLVRRCESALRAGAQAHRTAPLARRSSAVRAGRRSRIRRLPWRTTTSRPARRQRRREPRR